MSRTRKDTIIGITQRQEVVPSGYSFDPRRTPPLFKTPRVAKELPNERDQETTPTPEAGLPPGYDAQAAEEGTP